MAENPPNVTQIPAPRVDFIDKRTGLMSREWYRFFVNIYNIAGGGGSAVSLADLQVSQIGGVSFDAVAEMMKTVQDLELQPPVIPSSASVATVTFANPTAKVGSTAVNGTATTAMRSDAAPAFDLTANYTMTGEWTWSYAGTGSALRLDANATNWQASFGWNGTAELAINAVSFSGAPSLGLFVGGTRYMSISAAGNVNIATGTLTVNGAVIVASTGSPNGVVTGNPGDMYLNKSGGAGTTLYIKESGSGTNTGWVAK